MAKRLFDLISALAALVILMPIIALTVAGIRFSSPGPVFYHAQRVGRHGRRFVMYKFRTMHLPTPTENRPITGADRTTGSVITGVNDPRIFGFGRLLRTLKIDELPQLWNVITGTMSIVGPRPEDAGIVESYFGPRGMETLTVLPGLASYGSLYNYTHAHRYLKSDDPEHDYLRALLPVKLALELVYVRDPSLLRDFGIIGRTVLTILQLGLGRRDFPDPPELSEALALLSEGTAAFVTVVSESPDLHSGESGEQVC